MRSLGRGRLSWAVLAALVVSLGTSSVAEAAKRHHRHVSARAKAQHVVVADDVSTSSRYAAIVIDDKTGRVLYAKNADAPRHPASLTKMMTLYLLFEDLQKKKVGLTSRFAASVKASQQAPTKLGLRPGQTIAVEDAIRALVTKSANDAAVTIAENLGGSEEAFARRMTSTARRIGMKGSTFYNASGLPNDAQYTTARDMVILGRALQERFPTYYRYFSTRSFAWNGAVIPNHNHLMSRMEGIDGIKTGYTNASGFNLVSSYHKDGRHLVAAVMGGSSAGSRDDHMARLLTTYLPQASAGGKVSSVFAEEGGGRQADAGSDVDDEVTAFAEPERPVIPTPAPTRVATSEPVAPTAAPMALMAVDTTPAAPMPTVAASNRPRIAASDIVPIAPQERDTRRSADHGAAVAMARAILLPDAGRPMPVAAPIASPARAATPTPVPVRTTEIHPTRVASLAAPMPAPREGPIATGSVPPRRAEDPAPKTSGRTGWMVQIGAYDNDRAARAALDKAKAKGGAVVARAEGFTEQVAGGSGRLWRARFAGFADQKRAEDACKALKRREFACLALRQ